jgi:pyruvate/2-oxoglutarate dehydrogenase complex dihydrolipoamide dehydrogenase (E3) component
MLKDMAPDAVILATGSDPLILPIPGLDECGYITAQDMLEGKKLAGQKVLVVGGGMVGCEAAEFLAERAHDVAVIEMKDTIAGDVTAENRLFIFRDFERHHVQLVPGAKVSRFFTDGVSYTYADGTAGELRGFDTIVLAMGSRSYNPLEKEIAAMIPQTFVIGEAVKAPGNAMLATGEAFDAAMSI